MCVVLGCLRTALPSEIGNPATSLEAKYDEDETIRYWKCFFDDVLNPNLITVHTLLLFTRLNPKVQLIECYEVSVSKFVAVLRNDFVCIKCFCC